jgi:hypothetical protein
MFYDMKKDGKGDSYAYRGWPLNKPKRVIDRQQYENHFN